MNSVMSENGVIGKAQEAKEKKSISEDQERLQLLIADIKMKNFSADVLEYENYLKRELNSDNLQIDKANRKIIYNDNIYYINEMNQLTHENKGIILSKNSLNLQILGENKYDKTLELRKMNIDGNVTWSTSDSNIVTVDNGVVVPVAEGQATITATCIDEETYTAQCMVTVEAFIDDEYVQYEVEYEDMYSGKMYTKNTGWRLLTKEQNEDGTYNIEFISTGIPCNLNYGWYEIRDANWKGTDEQRNEYLSKFYDTTKVDNALMAASGLYYNFDKIPFKKQILNTEYNVGEYKKILVEDENKIMKEVTGEFTGEIFIIKEGAQVRSVTLSDIRGYDKIEGKEGAVEPYGSEEEYADRKLGLFRLADYTIDPYINHRSFFIANPTTIGSYYHIAYINRNGSTGTTNGGRKQGLRPVISMQNVNLTKDRMCMDNRRLNNMSKRDNLFLMKSTSKKGCSILILTNINKCSIIILVIVWKSKYCMLM